MDVDAYVDACMNITGVNVDVAAYDAHAQTDTTPYDVTPPSCVKTLYLGMP